MTSNRIQVFFSAVVFFLIAATALPAASQEQRKLSRIERKADRNFARQKFGKAMDRYETAIGQESEGRNRAAMHLKTARLYFMLRDYSNSAGHFNTIMEMSPEMLTVSDVCNYVDALRFTGQERKAEAICLDNAYKDIYSRYQRYQNTRDALAMRHSMVEELGYEVVRLGVNTPYSEYWAGYFDNQAFYAMSSSEFNDPGKLFNHRSHYYQVDETADPADKPAKQVRISNWFAKIPVDMQNGPVSFSEDMQTMIATVIEYEKKKTSVDIVDPDMRPFRTKLYYSTLRNNKRRFTRYKPVFPQESEFSYAHPFLLNNGETLLFTSDMPGGYGGFDLYICHFDEGSGTWGTPVNLGPSVNTEGDEISPVVHDGQLIFASNGLPGFGGYDLFSIHFEADGVIPGMPNHFPYPVNSIFNDYYMCPTGPRSAYFISDRDLETRDDIYFLRTADDLSSANNQPYFGLSEANAIQGGQLLLNGMVEDNLTTRHVDLKGYLPEGLVLTLYFNFDSSELTPESIEQLRHFTTNSPLYRFDELLVNGYADEMGSDSYNFTLSTRRANKVAEYLRTTGIDSALTVQGFGRLKLSPEEIQEEIEAFNWSEQGINWIQVNRKARRVEIYNKRINKK